MLIDSAASNMGSTLEAGVGGLALLIFESLDQKIGWSVNVKKDWVHAETAEER
mgnify:CR=1 FL=1